MQRTQSVQVLDKTTLLSFMFPNLQMLKYGCLTVENDITCCGLLLALLEVVVPAKIPKCNMLLSTSG